MTPKAGTKTLRKLILSFRERMNKLGIQDDPYLLFLLEQSMCPIQRVAYQFATKLDRKLTDSEFNQAIHGYETLPDLPPETSIEIGKTVQQGLPFRIPITKVLHWLVAGTTGFGKTTLACVVEQAVRGLVPCTFLDHKDESARLIARVPGATFLPLDKQRWNLLKGVGDQSAYIRYISSQLANFMSLHPVTANAVRAKLLALCHDKASLPSLSDLGEIFLKLAQKELRSSLHTASRGFEDLAVSFGRWANVRHGEWPITSPLNVIPLKDLPPTIEHFYVSLLLKHMTDRASALGHSTELNHMLFFDEALNYMGKEMEPTAGSGRENHVATMMRICRSYGISIFAAVQSLSKIQDSVIDNASVFIAFRANSTQEATLAGRRLGLEKRRYPELMNLEPGVAFALTPDCHQPVKVKIPFVDLGDYPSYTDISRRMKPIWTAWDQNTVFSPARNQNIAHIDFHDLLDESNSETTVEPIDPPKPTSEIRKPQDPVIISEYLAMLRSCEAHPDFGATTHYKSLGWSMGRGNRVKAQLVELGWVETASVISPKGGRPKITLQLTETGRGVLDEPA